MSVSNASYASLETISLGSRSYCSSNYTGSRKSLRHSRRSGHYAVPRFRRSNSETIHLERNGIIVSSDDSSDDEDVLSYSSHTPLPNNNQDLSLGHKSNLYDGHVSQNYSMPVEANQACPPPLGFAQRADSCQQLGVHPAGMKAMQRRLPSRSQSFDIQCMSPTSLRSFSSTSCSSGHLETLPPTPSSVTTRRKANRLQSSKPGPRPSSSSSGGLVSQSDIRRMSPPITLYLYDFWDPYGSKARFAERAVFGAGLSICFVCVWLAKWLYLGLMLVLTCVLSSWVISKYRILSWRAKSGIKNAAVFNEIYCVAETVCVNTCIKGPNQDLKARQVCAGEIAQALRNYHGESLTRRERLRFWCDACAHFRLTLRSGCEHLAEGKLKPSTLTTASLVRFNKGYLPQGACSTCKNKTEIEAKFPMRFS